MISSKKTNIFFAIFCVLLKSRINGLLVFQQTFFTIFHLLFHYLQKMIFVFLCIKRFRILKLTLAVIV